MSSEEMFFDTTNFHLFLFNTLFCPINHFVNKLPFLQSLPVTRSVTVHEQSSQQNRSLWHWDNALVRTATVVH
jgi:hypothetical protein